MPLGPNEVRIASLTAFAADRFERRTSSGLSVFLNARYELGRDEAVWGADIFEHRSSPHWSRTSRSALDDGFPDAGAESELFLQRASKVEENVVRALYTSPSLLL